MLSKKLLGLVAGFMCLAASFGLHAQNLTVRGTISDSAGPVVGAVVLCNGANAVSDMNGAYAISASPDAVLEVSCLGYEDQRIKVNGRSVIDIVLAEDVEMLHEAVALGYGAQTKKKDLSASVGIVNDTDELASRPVTSATAMLQGQIPGVVVSQDGGAPDAGFKLLIRGQGSRNGDSVLWVVDGVPGAPITSLNDIESMVVLKDAASAAIYGATSGAGGVILVTTKKAKSGIHIEYNAVAGVRSASNVPHGLTIDEEIQMRTISSANAGIALDEGWDVTKNPWIGTNRTDWIDEIFRTAFYQRHGVSLDYGTDKLKSRLSFSFQDNPGVLAGTYSKNIGIRYNGEYQVNKWIKLSERISYGDGSSRGVNTNSAYSGAILSALYMPSSAEAYATSGPNAGSFGGTTTEDPEYIATYGDFSGIYGDAINPLRILLGNNLYYHNTSFWSTTGLELANIVSGLKFNTLFSYNTEQGLSKEFRPKRPEVGKPDLNNRLEWKSGRGDSWRSESTLTYDKTFGKHTLGLLGAVTFDHANERGFSTWGTGFEDESEYLQYLAFAASGTIDSSDYYNGDDANIALVTRAAYSYDDRYFLTASWRRDYAGRLPSGHNKGDFPAVTGAWKISSEPFFPQNDIINFLKLRASWGRVGNLSSIGWNYKSANLSKGYTSDYSPFGFATGGTRIGYFWYPSKAVNQNLTWETSQQFDAGMDAYFLSNRLSVSFDYYNKLTYNLIQDQTMGWPKTIGYDPMKVNQGKIRNSGIELIATWRDHVGKDFSYYVTGNFAYNKNEVVSTGIVDENGNEGKWTGGGDFRAMPWIYQSEAGQPLNSFYVIKTDGIFQSDAEAAAYTFNGNRIQPNAVAGDLKFVDYNEDGVIDEKDRQYVGSAMPKYTFALSAGFEWKNFNFDMQWQGMAGNKVAYVAKQMTLSDGDGNFNRSQEILDAWSPTNTGSSIPILSRSDLNGNFSTPSDYYIEDGSFLRLKSLTIGYDLTSAIRSINHFAERGSALNIYITGENLLTITKYSGMDPEVGGWDAMKYPVSRVFAFGVKLTY